MLLTPYPSPGMIPPKYVPHLPKPKELANQRRRGLASGPQAVFGSTSGTNAEVTTAPRNCVIKEYITAMGTQNHAKIKFWPPKNQVISHKNLQKCRFWGPMVGLFHPTSRGYSSKPVL